MFDWRQLEALYSAEQTRALDARAIRELGIPGAILMSRAATAALSALLERWPQPGCLQVLCGSGNNGGDGYLLAEQAYKRGLSVAVWQLADPARLRGDAAAAWEQARGAGVPMAAWQLGCLRTDGVLVDGMLGTGLGGEVRGPVAQAIRECNQSGLPILALDIPSGLCADTGRILGDALRADLTVTFIGFKRGLFTLDGPACRGALLLNDLALPEEAFAAVPRPWRRLSLEALLAAWPPRSPSDHKGRFGTVLVVGGDHGMGGAALLAAESALRSGAGLVRVATREAHLPGLLARRPEAMGQAVRNGADLEPLLQAADVVVAGPGLGQGSWGQQLLQAVLAANRPVVLDADALNLLVAHPAWLQGHSAPRVLTPHPGEAARLLSLSTAAVQVDRFAAVEALQQRWGGVAVLKGNGSLITDGQTGVLSDYGNPGMASGGMGDVLAGLVGGLLAQGLPPLQAAALAVAAHGAAGDQAAAEGQRGLLAADLMAPLRGYLG